MDTIKEMLALAGLTEATEAKPAKTKNGVSEKKVGGARQPVAEQIDPRVAQYVQELDSLAVAVGEQIDRMYAQANAACSLDPNTCGGVQSAIGMLRHQLSDVFAEMDKARRIVVSGS